MVESAYVRYPDTAAEVQQGVGHVKCCMLCCKEDGSSDILQDALHPMCMHPVCMHAMCKYPMCMYLCVSVPCVCIYGHVWILYIRILCVCILLPLCLPVQDALHPMCVHTVATVPTSPVLFGLQHDCCTSQLQQVQAQCSAQLH